MTLQQLSSLAQIIGVAGVFISVLYLARQVKAGNDLSRTDTFRSIMQGLGVYCNAMYGPENEELIEKGFRDFNALSPYEKIRFENLMVHLFNYVEDSYHSSNVDLLGKETMENWVYWLRTRYFAYRGVREWWRTGKGAYAPEFQAWIDSVVESADIEQDIYGLSGSP